MSGLSFLDGGGGVSFEGSLMGELSPKVGLIFFLPLIQGLVGFLSLSLSSSSTEDVLIDFRERGTERGREAETAIICLSPVPQWRTEPASQACALTRNPTWDLSAYRTMLQPH